jgi:hypothetical protein
MASGENQMRVAIVTGGGSGIGAATCTGLAAAGARVVVADISFDAAESTAAQIHQREGQALAVHADVADPASVCQMVQTVHDAWGRASILVNNAGICPTTPLLEISLDEWNKVLAVNLTSVLLCSQAVLPDMMENRWGRIVGEYWEALDATQALVEHIRQFKGDRPFDLELAVDEHTPDIPTCACITTDDEVAFVLLELKRRGIPATHLAPNFGAEKSVDYRCPDGLAGLAARVRSQCQIAEEFGVLLDFHSGDDLSSEMRRVIGRATGGRNHLRFLRCRRSSSPRLRATCTQSCFAAGGTTRWNMRSAKQRAARILPGCVSPKSKRPRRPHRRTTPFSTILALPSSANGIAAANISIAKACTILTRIFTVNTRAASQPICVAWRKTCSTHRVRSRTACTSSRR